MDDPVRLVSRARTPNVIPRLSPDGPILILHPDIPEQGPHVFSPASINAAGYFVGGPQLAVNAGWLKLIELAKSEEQQNEALLAALNAENETRVRRKLRVAKREATRDAQRAALERARAEYRAMRVAA